jgi:hypothetical protein
MTLGPTQPVCLRRVKWLGREVDHTPPYGAHIPLLPLFAFMVWTGTTLLRLSETQIIGLSSAFPDFVPFGIICPCYPKKTAVRVYGEV